MSIRDFAKERDLTLELTIAEAAAGYDFTVRENIEGKGYVLPRAFIITGGGTLSFLDASGRARTLTAAAGRVYPATIASITGCSGTGFVQLFANASAARGASGSFNAPINFDFSGDVNLVLGDQITVYPDAAGFINLPPHPLILGSGPWGLVLVTNISGINRAVHAPDAATIFDAPSPLIVPDLARRLLMPDGGTGSGPNWSVINL